MTLAIITTANIQKMPLGAIPKGIYLMFINYFLRRSKQEIPAKH